METAVEEEWSLVVSRQPFAAWPSVDFANDQRRTTNDYNSYFFIKCRKDR